MTEQDTTFGPSAPVIGRRKRALAGLADQAFNAGANATNGLVAGILLGPSSYGRYVAAIGVAFITVAVARAFIGEVLLTHTARARGEAYQKQIQDASATALGVGAVAVVLAGAVWMIGFDLMSDLLWLAPFLPAALLSDAGRYAFLSQRRPQRSMAITGVALLVQLGVVVGLASAGAIRPATLLVAWGLGVVVGAVVAVSLLSVNPFRGRPRRWTTDTGHLSGWFMASAVLAQTQNWVALYFVGGFLGHAELGGLRMLQMLVLMPVQNLIWALAGMIVPGYSHFAHDGDLRRIRRRTGGLVVIFGVVTLGLVALVPAGEWLVARWLPEYADFDVLIMPIALQAGLYLLQSPFNAALRGMQRAKYAFVQYAVFTAVILPASLIGAVTNGIAGAAYGMVVGAAAGCVAAYVCYHRAMRDLQWAVDTGEPAATNGGVPVPAKPDETAPDFS
jgi:O-antigen/teichoic acid export membrane protein